MISTDRVDTDVQLPVLVIDIDFVPHGCLQSTISAYLSALESNTRLVVNVTTVALGTPLLSHKFLLCSLPFLPRQYLKAGSGASPRRGLGSLLTPLHRIIELISQHQVTVKAVENVSKAREKELWALEQQLVNDRALRTSTTGNYGIEGWREHRFLTAWEAALLSNGHLVRWSVIICK
ncbi:hypothetical protein BD779DRAFT_1670894 [Infundibulicybe gibba]|nr:hypothetical protein BD779DRAFT_1670894 [Infundibulicybe gibba]